MNLQIKLHSFFDKFIQYGFPLICFIIPLAFYLKTYDSCFIKITLAELTGAIFPMVFLLKVIESNNYSRIFKDKEYNKIFFPVILVLLSGILSYFLTPFKIQSFEELIRKIIYVSVFFVVAFEFNTLKRVERLILFLILATLISSLYGILQAIGLDPFKWKGAFGPRIFSTFGNPNFFSAYLVWTIPIMLSYLILSRKWAYLFVILISVICVFLSGSKASWIGLSTAFVVFAFLSVEFFAHLDKKNLKKLMIVFVSSIVILSSFAVWFFITKRVDSVRFRVFTWEATIKMIVKPIYTNPVKSIVLGSGIGTFKTIYPKYRRPEIFFIEAKHNTATEHPENEILEILYEEGIVGFSLFFFMLFMIFYFAIKKIDYIAKTDAKVPKKNRKKEEIEKITMQHYLVGLLSGISGMLMHNTMCVNMRFVSSGIFFWIQLGLVVSILRAYDNRDINTIIPHQNKIVLKRIGQIILIFISIFLSKRSIDFFKGDYYHNIGIAYSKAKQYTGAIKYYQKVIDLNPHFVMAHYFMGNIFVDREDLTKTYHPELGDKNNIPRNDMERALAKFDDVKKMAPDYVQTHFQVGRIFVVLGDYEKALENFKKAQELDPVFEGTYFQMANIYQSLGEQDKQLETFERLLKYHPQNIHGNFNLGNLYYLKGDMEKAEFYYLNTINIDKNFIQAYRNLIHIYITQNQIEKAKNLAKKLLLIQPQDEFANKILNS